MNRISKTPTRRKELGLTLLEVLAAAMIFAMVMTVLIGTSSTAVHNVGVSARRLEANLVADEMLADLEIQMKQGFAPEVDENESTRDQYSILVIRTDLFQESDAAEANSGGTAGAIASLLGSDLPEVAKHLKQYDIEVSWIEQNGPQTVSRTTFAFDWETAAIEFGDLFARSNRAGGGTEQSGDGSDGGAGGATGGDGAEGADRPAFGDGGRNPLDVVPTQRRGGRNARKEYFRQLEEANEN